MVRTLRSVIAIATFLLVVSAAVPAFGAPVAFESVEITLHTDNAPVLMISGQLAADAPLPAEVELSAPAGAEVQWAGEVLGGPVAEDPTVQYTKTAGDGFDIYRFTLTKSRTAQIELLLPGAQAFDGKTYATAISWTPTQDVPSLRMSVRLKTGAQVVKAAPGAEMLPGASGDSYYSKTFEGVKAGAPVDLAFAYTLPGVGQSATTAGGSDVVPVAVIGVLALAVFLLVAFAVRGKLAAKAAAREAEEGDLPVEGVTEATAVTDEATAARTGLHPKHVVTGVIILGLAIAVFVMARQATSSAFVGGTLTRSFGGAGACAKMTVPLTPKEGVDFEADAGKLMDSLKGLDSVAMVTITLEPPSIEVNYCESTLTEQQVRGALESAGVATLGAGVITSSEATAAPAPAQ